MWLLLSSPDQITIYLLHVLNLSYFLIFGNIYIKFFIMFHVKHVNQIDYMCLTSKREQLSKLNLNKVLFLAMFHVKHC